MRQDLPPIQSGYLRLLMGLGVGDTIEHKLIPGIEQSPAATTGQEGRKQECLENITTETDTEAREQFLTPTWPWTWHRMGSNSRLPGKGKSEKRISPWYLCARSSKSWTWGMGQINSEKNPLWPYEGQGSPSPPLKCTITLTYPTLTN